MYGEQSQIASVSDFMKMRFGAGHNMGKGECECREKGAVGFAKLPSHCRRPQDIVCPAAFPVTTSWFGLRVLDGGCGYGVLRRRGLQV